MKTKKELTEEIKLLNEIIHNQSVLMKNAEKRGHDKAMEECRDQLKPVDPMKDLRGATDKAVKFIDDKGIYFEGCWD